MESGGHRKLSELSREHATAWIGYAGACRPENTYPRAPRCKVDLKKWNVCREEWERRFKLSLDQADESVERQPPDPFQALKNGELVVKAIA